MGLIGWLQDRLGTKSVPLTGICDEAEEWAELMGDTYIRETAFWSAVNLMANAISKCEFQTFLNGKEEKGKEYYLWNIEPNRNQNSSGFIHKWISQLYRNNECLIIENNGELLVADSFVRTPYTLYDDQFTQVMVDGFSFYRTFQQSEVLYWQLNNNDMRELLNGLYTNYSKLISYSMNAYQHSRGTKGIFQYDTLPAVESPERKTFESLLNEKMGKWLSADSAVLPMGRGQEFKELTRTTYASESTRDIRALIDDVSDMTAKAFGIPPALLRGDIQDTSKAVDQLLTFAVDPLADMLAEEINRKRNGYTGFSRGNYMVIDTKTMKHVDLLTVSTSIDKLVSSGVFCVNDIRKLVDMPVIDEPWAWDHWVTKNYAPMDEALQTLGGE